MFAIRIICDRADIDSVVVALDAAFNAGTITVYPDRHGKQDRLYLSADHKNTETTSVPEWPSLAQAYATAPDAAGELAWLCDREPHERDRQWWLRRAAVADRMAAGLAPGTVTDEQARAVAQRLMGLDDPDVICDPRAYVRQQYARTLVNHQ
ncbi:hypothetical protein ACH4U3_04250 [Streptomyces griseoruber]|uniref:hypothetical protein n=1 Tax=Streptomyces griseoruber TaxID=1943 RepID=UPI00379B8A49